MKISLEIKFIRFLIGGFGTIGQLFNHFQVYNFKIISFWLRIKQMYNSMSKTTHVSKIQVFLMTEILWDADFFPENSNTKYV